MDSAYFEGLTEAFRRGAELLRCNTEPTRRESYYSEPQENIEKCMNCPLPECVNCLAGGKTTATKAGRPRTVSAERLQEMIALGISAQEVCEALGISKSTFYRNIKASKGEQAV